jgi:hypothetical protein
VKPSQIFEILDLAKAARKNGHTFNPCFVSPPGLGKSEIVAQWAKAHGMGFIDVRLAYKEAPDMVGFPSVEKINGRSRTVFNTPEFWPNEGEGVLFLDEVNRGTNAVMNTIMQLLTDRKVDKYDLPPGWIIVAAINPENEENDVNTMDPALKNRFEMFEVQYDAESFIAYMKATDWDKRVVDFVRGNFWRYAKPEEISGNVGSKYISPRSMSKLNAALKAGVDQKNENIQSIVFESVLGLHYGKQFLNFISKERPVSVRDLQENEREALARLKVFSNADNYQNGHISLFVEDLKANYVDIPDEVLANVLLALPADQGYNVLRELEYSRKEKAGTLLTRITANNTAVKKYFAKNLKKD